MKPYSVRFMSRRGTPQLEVFEVPEGYRAVVTHITCAFWGNPGEGTLFMHGVALWYVTRPAAFTTVFEAVRFTAYERETIRFATTGVDVSYSIDGYLLTDPDGRPDDADNTLLPWPGAIPGQLDLEDA